LVTYSKKENLYISMSIKKNILETKSLAVGYQQNKSVAIIQQDINLQLLAGEFVTILGKNGIGKSTLLRTLTKVQEPISGDVFLQQKKIQSYSLKELSMTISLVLTEKLPESQLTVFELVALGRQPYTNWIGKLQENDIERITSALKLTETDDLAQKHFHELSDGQLQRVLIARALAQDTKIIMLDEPTAHLDMHHTIKIFQLLKKLSKETKKTIIITTHEVNLAINAADQLILLTENNVISGTKDELIASDSFNALFPSDIVNFNTSLEQFIIKKN
tara:strand:- start:22430 stop:23260 length:831 start_codon:yes stop_codon:yes gene_type:complete